ncbi:hypothetical protein GCM10007100_19830 [Roseibacillus persicicus]|uniref:Uncharacterized protein n=1 Tax=Roseibacillus persicicus TaxID=454148 RepID=A0A918TP04_9BACT|nr:hypothetical protein GCM10007100_19830 [Roseibacillus persicicus]
MRLKHPNRSYPQPPPDKPQAGPRQTLSLFHNLPHTESEASINEGKLPLLSVIKRIKLTESTPQFVT